MDATTRELAAGFLSAGVAKAAGRFDHAERGVRWAQIALVLTRIGAVLVPLSTLPTGLELIAQLRVASVRYHDRGGGVRATTTSTTYIRTRRNCLRSRPSGAR